MRLDRQEIEAALSLLLDEMEGDLGPSHEVYLRLVQILDAMRATGMPLPEDLVAMERDLAAEFEGGSSSPSPKPGRRNVRPKGAPSK